jgi:hypothetical protein
VRRTPPEPDQWFVGLTPLSNFASWCSLGIAIVSVLAIALGVASPWLGDLAALDRAYPGYALSAVAGVGPAALYFLVAFFLLIPLGNVAAMFFTAQSGIRRADTIPTSPVGPPEKIVSAPRRPATRRRNQPSSKPEKKSEGQAGSG